MIPRAPTGWAILRNTSPACSKAWYGDNATAANDFCYSYLPKRMGNYAYGKIMEKMGKGELEGLVCMGMNPAVGGPDSGNARTALGKLKWLVTVDLWETETSIFWKRPGVNPRISRPKYSCFRPLHRWKKRAPSPTPVAGAVALQGG